MDGKKAAEKMVGSIYLAHQVKEFLTHLKNPAIHTLFFCNS